MYAKTNTLGVIRVLTPKYVELKNNVITNDYRKFRLDSSGSFSQDGKVNLIPQNEKLELASWHLPPKYMELYDKCNDILKELYIKFNTLQENQQMRIMTKFRESENRLLDRKIRENMKEMTNKIREIDDNIKYISMEKLANSKEEGIRDNIKQNILGKLGEFTKKLKINEEEYMRKYQDLVGDNTEYNFNEKSNEIQSSKKDFGNFLKSESKSEDILNNRDNEIGNLVNSINELANIFKHLNTLVLEQGTILDRIDHNIETASTNTSQAHKELKKADENMKSNCYRNTNMILILIIFLLAVFNIFKYT